VTVGERIKPTRLLAAKKAHRETPGRHGKEFSMADERRIAKRFAIQLNKITSAEVTRDGSGGPTPCYVYVADISEGGLRITTDTWFDRGEQFHLMLMLNPPLDGRVEVVWSKQLTGGTNVYGVKFVEMSEALKAQIAAFIESFSEASRRLSKSVSLNRVLCMQFPELTHDKRIYVLTSVLGTDSMQVTAEIPFEQGRTYDCLLFLDPDAAPVVVKAIAREVKAAVFDRFKIAFEFASLSADGTERINGFLDRVISGDVDRPVIHREMSFDEP
jgi:hypothetical protein